MGVVVVDVFDVCVFVVGVVVVDVFRGVFDVVLVAVGVVLVVLPVTSFPKEAKRLITLGWCQKRRPVR